MTKSAQDVYRVMHLTYSFLPENKSMGYCFRKPLPNGHVYKPHAHFAQWETSALLNHVMPCDYIQCTWDMNNELGIEEAQKVLIQGLSSSTVPGFPAELGRWEYFCGTARDHIKAIFVPAGSNLDLSEVGIDVDLTPAKKTLNEMAATAMKRLNRLFAPVEFAVFGEVVDSKEDDGQVFTVLTEGDQRFDILVLPADVYTDGMNFLSARGAELLAGMQEPQTGDCCRITCATPFGLAKGHAMVKEDLAYDAILYGIKAEVKFRGFYFGRLSELHVSDPNTDFQSLINFMITGKGLDLLGVMYEKFFTNQVDACQDSGRFTRMMRGVLDRNPDTTWLRARAAALGMDACFPGLFRSDIKMLMPAINRTREGVVPMATFATRRYIMPEPFMFDQHGQRITGRLKGNAVFSAGVPAGPVVLYRQPNGNVDEHWSTSCVRTPHKNMGRGQIIFLGADMIPGALAAMGGGDFDDPVIVVHNQDMVNHFIGLPAYPKVDVTVEAPKPSTEPRNLKYVNRILNRIDPNQWSLHHLLKQIEDLRSVTGIGVVVNAIMLDTLLTVGKETMLIDLTTQISRLQDLPEKAAEREKLVAAFNWLSERPDYLLRRIASDLESRIDSIKMLGGGGMSEDEALINAMYETTQVFPYCWTIGGYLGTGRIPVRAQRNEPAIAKTQLCHLLTEVTQEIGALQEAFTEIEWMLVKPLPQELLSKYRRDKELDQYVSEMRVWWRESWDQARETADLNDSEVVRAVYQRLEEELEMHLADSPFSDRIGHVAVALAKRIYRGMHATAPLNDDGKTYHVPDGLLWTRPLGIPFLEALEKAGLTGVNAKVSFNYGARTEPGVIMVIVDQGLVIDADDGKVYGTATGVPESVLGTDTTTGDGKLHKYVMLDGYIEVKPVHPALKNDWHLV